MRVRHDEIVISNSRIPAAPDSSAMDIHVFPKDVVITDREKRFLAFEFQVLRLKTDRCKRIKLIGVADRRRAFNNNVRFETATVADLNTRSDSAVRPNPNIIPDLRFRTDNRRRMDHGC
jgi:hypothetical protein